MFYYDIYEEDNFIVKTLTAYKGSYKSKIVLENDVVFFDMLKTIFSRQKIFALHINRDLIGMNFCEYDSDMLLSLKDLQEKVLHKKIRCNSTNLNKHKFDYLNLDDYKISEITVDKDSLFYSSVDKNLCSKNKKILIYHHYTDDKKIVLNDIYKYIRTGAFNALKHLEYIDINNVICLDDTLASPFSSSMQNTRFVLRAKNLNKINYVKDDVKRYSHLDKAILIFHKIPSNLDKFYIVRMLHGFMLYKELYKEDEIKAYTNLLNTYKYDFLIYLKNEDLDTKTQEIVSHVLSLFEDRDRPFLLKYLTLYSDYEDVKDFLDKNRDLSIDTEVLAFALRYRESSFTKLLLEYVKKDYSICPKFFLYAVLDSLHDNFIDVNKVFYDTLGKECFYKEKINTKERLQSIKYLYNLLQDNTYFIELYFFSLCCNEKAIASYLYKQGVRLKNTLYADIIEAKIKDERRDNFLYLLFNNSYELVYTYTAYEDISITLIYKDYDVYIINYIVFNNDSLDNIIPYFKFQPRLCHRIIMDLIKFDKDLSILDLDLALEHFKIRNIDIYLDYALSLNKDKDLIAYLLDKQQNKRQGTRKLKL